MARQLLLSSALDIPMVTASSLYHASQVATDFPPYREAVRAAWPMNPTLVLAPTHHAEVAPYLLVVLE